VIVSRRFVVLAVLGACWSSKPEPARPMANEPRREMMVQMHDPPACAQFDASDPACAEHCPPEAPDGWPGCLAARDKLVARGFTCPTANPRQCTAPAPAPPQATCPTGGCVAVKTRIVMVQVAGNGLRITFGAGANHGVTMAWKAMVVDDADVPVPGGAVTLVRVDKGWTAGTVMLTTQQVQNARFVRLEP
jgi:hypothetical protein